MFEIDQSRILTILNESLHQKDGDIIIYYKYKDDENFYGDKTYYFEGIDEAINHCFTRKEEFMAEHSINYEKNQIEFSWIEYYFANNEDLTRFLSVFDKFRYS